MAMYSASGAARTNAARMNNRPHKPGDFKRDASGRAPFDRAMFTEMLDSIDDAYVAFDATGAVVSRNAAFAEIPGDHRELEHEGRRLALSHARSASKEGKRDFATRCGGYRLRITHAGPHTDAARLVLVAYEPIHTSAARSPLALHHRLTPREVQVAQLVAEGRTNHDVAKVLGVSQHTVRHHVARVLAKLGVARRGELAARFWRS